MLLVTDSTVARDVIFLGKEYLIEHLGFDVRNNTGRVITLVIRRNEEGKITEVEIK